MRAALRPALNMAEKQPPPHSHHKAPSAMRAVWRAAKPGQGWILKSRTAPRPPGSVRAPCQGTQYTAWVRLPTLGSNHLPSGPPKRHRRQSREPAPESSSHAPSKLGPSPNPAKQPGKVACPGRRPCTRVPRTRPTGPRHAQSVGGRLAEHPGGHRAHQTANSHWRGWPAGHKDLRAGPSR